MKRLADFVVKALASCFFLTTPQVQWTKARGCRWTGAGFIGTLAGLASCRILAVGPLSCALVLLAVLFISVAVSDRAEELFGHKDDQRIVIDEWAGYLVSIAFLPQTPLILILAFVLFRIVDVSKPLSIDRLGNLPGGWGVVLDDIAGGVVVNVLLHLIPH